MKLLSVLIVVADASSAVLQQQGLCRSASGLHGGWCHSYTDSTESSPLLVSGMCTSRHMNCERAPNYATRKYEPDGGTDSDNEYNHRICTNSNISIHTSIQELRITRSTPNRVSFLIDFLDFLHVHCCLTTMSTSTLKAYDPCAMLCF